MSRFCRRFFVQIFTVILCLLLVSCGGKKAGSSVGSEVIRQMPPVPSAPSVVTDGGKAVEYMVSQFWDEFLEGNYLCDSTHVNGVAAEDV